MRHKTNTKITGELKVQRRSVFANSLIVILCVAGLILNAQPPRDIYKTASQLYKTNQFEQAASSYEKILQQGYKNAEVYYNLGNCYYKLNNISKAILNYERASKLAPRDEDIQHNLKIADTRIIDKIQPVPQLAVITMWNSFIGSNSSHGWGIYALGLIWAALLFFAVYLFIGLRQFSLTFGSILLVASIAFISLAFKQSEKEQNSDSAILTIANSFVKSAPDNNGNDLFMLHEGVKFQLLDRVGDWEKIRLADGKVGWLEKKSFEKI